MLITLVDPVDNRLKGRSNPDCACEQSVASSGTQFHEGVDTQFHGFLDPQRPPELSAETSGAVTSSSTNLSTAVVFGPNVLAGSV